MKKGTSALLAILSGAAGAGIGMGITIGKTYKKIDWCEQRIDKFKNYFDILNQWMVWKNAGRNLSEYFEKAGYKRIVIYGMGELGCRLYEELRNTDIKVMYAIDKNGGNGLHPEVQIVDLENCVATMDVVVITPIYQYESIEEMLLEIVDVPVISLEEVIYNM